MLGQGDAVAAPAGHAAPHDGPPALEARQADGVCPVTDVHPVLEGVRHDGVASDAILVVLRLGGSDGQTLHIRMLVRSHCCILSRTAACAGLVPTGCKD